MPSAKTGSKKTAVTPAKATTKKAPAKKAPVKEVAAKAAPVAAKPAKVSSKTAGKAAAKPRRHPVNADQRRYYVEVAAYYIAERNGFAPGRELENWTAAEAEIDRLLAEGALNP